MNLKKTSDELIIANRELAFQNEEKEKRAAELVIANKELVFQNDEKEKRAAELTIANKELIFQNEEKEKRAAELVIANKELVFQSDEKEKRAAELVIANKEFVFQNTEKEKRAAELIIANKELAFQNEEKEKRATELIIANKELIFQNEEKEKRAAELVIANKELVFQSDEKEKRATELIIAFAEKEKFLNILQKSLNEIYIINVHTHRFEYANEAALGNIGYSMQEMLNMTSLDIMPGYTITSYQELIAPLITGEKEKIVFETVHKRADSSAYYVEVHLQLVAEATDQVFLAVVIDITETKKAGEKLLASEIRYRRLFETAKDGILILNADTGKIEDVNPYLIELLGYSYAEFMGREVWEISLFKDIFKNKIEFLKLKEEGYNWHDDLPLKTKSGETIYVEFVSNAYVSNGKLVMQCNIRNITERKKAEAEIKALNECLEQKIIERTGELEAVNKELEAFSYSVSHDLRAPLRAINGYARMLEEDYNTLFDEEGKRLLSVVRKNANKMGVLIDDLLAFSRLGKKEVKKSLIDMTQLTENVLSEISKTINNKAHIKMDVLSPVMGDYTLIGQVMTNLISNAVKYSSKTANPVIEIKSEEKNGETIFSVSDNGAGFDMQYIHKLFGVFQRLHAAEEFEGTGVGLAIVQRIITKHGGKAWAKGALGKGATIYFSLPVDKTKKNN